MACNEVLTHTQQKNHNSKLELSLESNHHSTGNKKHENVNLMQNKRFNIDSNKWKSGKQTLILILTLRFNDWVIQLYKKVRYLFIWLALQNDHAILFKDVPLCFIFFKKLPYQSNVLFKFYCIIGFVYAYKINQSIQV